MPTWSQRWDRASGLLAPLVAPSRRAILIFAIVTAAYFVHMAAALPSEPRVLYDSRRFLAFVDYLPPGYHLFLAAYQTLTGSLAFLSQVQLGLTFLGVALLGLGSAAVSRNILAAYFITLLGVTFPPSEPYTAVMSDSLFGALMAAGAGVVLFYAARPRAVLLALAAGVFGLAIAVRTIGEVLPVTLALVMALLILTRKLRLAAAAAVLVPTAAIMLAAAAYTWSQSGEFKIGSTGGDSIFGKGLLVASQLPPENPYSRFNWLAAEVAPAQESFERAQDPILAALMARQYYEYLRWQIAFPQMSDHWPEWRGKDFGQQGELVEPIAKAYIAARPLAYARLVALDYGSLWLVPHRMTRRERNFMQARLDALGPVAFLREGENLTDGDYRKVVGRNQSRADVWVVRLASFGAFAASVLAGLLLLTRRSARMAPAAPAVLFLCAAVHGSFLGTALYEAGLERYAAPSWPLILALLTLMPVFLRESFAKPTP